MSVYARCTKCKCRRDKASENSPECQDKTGHKRHVMWTADVQFIRNGPRVSKSFPSEEHAIKQERQWHTHHDEGKLVKTKSTQTFADAIEKYKRDHVLIHNHLPQRSAVYVLETLKEALGRVRLCDMTQDTIADARAALVADRDWEGATANRQFRIAHAILEKARQWKWLDQNPMEFLDALPESETHPRFLTEAEIYQLWKHIKDPRLDLYAFTILRTGARPSSIKTCSFDAGDVDLESGTIWFTTHKGFKSKKHRYPVPIDELLLPRIQQRYKETGGTGLVFDTSGVDKAARLAVQASGVNIGKPEGRHFTIYGLKHCYVSHSLASGANLLAVKDLLGHTDLKMIQKHYGHLTMDHLRAAQGKWTLAPQMAPQGVELKVV